MGNSISSRDRESPEDTWLPGIGQYEHYVLIDAADDPVDTTLLGAVAAAENLAVALDAVADNPGTAVRAGWSEHVDRALVTVEDVLRASVCRYREGLVDLLYTIAR